ncbi:MAG: MBL fold metallo-hydrolase [Panacibacter sp.]
MSLFIASLNSGSNGNCYYVGNNDEAVLIDAGLSCREIEKRMKRLGLLMNKVKAIFVSHEHSDHIFGIPVLSKKYQLPVYITSRTLLNSRLSIQQHLVIPFAAGNPVTIGGLSIKAFIKFHDADDPHSFTVTDNSVRIGIFTDIGRICEQLINHFSECHAAFLEANYDEQMLAEGGYPYHLKKRISGGNGHLSNTLALQLFNTYRPPFMTHLLLSHLSKNNNDPLLVHDLFKPHCGNVEIVIASRYQESPVYEIKNSAAAVTVKRPQKALQLSIF